MSLANIAFMKAANIYRKSNCNGRARPLLIGEKHIGCHNFSGPGTVLSASNLAFKPYNNIDACSRQHDIDYNNTKNLSGEERKKAIRKADEIVLSCYDNHKNDSGYALAKAGIKGKILAETVAPNVVEKVAGVDYLGGKKGKKKKPNRWLLHVKAVQKASGLTYKQSMVKAKLSYKK